MDKYFEIIKNKFYSSSKSLLFVLISLFIFCTYLMLLRIISSLIKNNFLLLIIMVISILVAILPIGYFTIRYHDFIYGYKIKNSQIKFLKEEKESQFESISNKELIKKINNIPKKLSCLYFWINFNN